MPVRSKGSSNFSLALSLPCCSSLLHRLLVLAPVAWELMRKSPSKATDASGCCRGKGKCGYGASALLCSQLMPNSLLLLVQECVEHGFFNVHFVRAPVGVDERIPGTLLELRVLFLHVVLGGVVAKRHVACERPH